MQKHNKLTILIIGLIVIALFYLLKPILTPFLAAALLAYLSDPLVKKITRFGIPRLVSVIIVFLGLFLIIALLILLLIPLIQTQISSLISTVPDIISWSQVTVLPWVSQNFGIDETLDMDTLKTTLATNLSKASGVVEWIVAAVFHSGFAIAEVLTNLILIPVVTFYLLRDWNTVLTNARSLIPRHIEPTMIKLIKNCDEVLSAFFRGQLLVMLSLGIIYSLGLSLMGLKIGLMIGLIAGLVSIVPYLGFIVGIVAASIAAYVQFGTFASVVLVWAVFAVGQSLESTILTPKLVGKRIGLHPVAVIFAVLAGGSLFGFFGVLLALPVAAVIMVLLRFATSRYRHSGLYKA